MNWDKTMPLSLRLLLGSVCRLLVLQPHLDFGRKVEFELFRCCVKVVHLRLNEKSKLDFENSSKIFN